MTKVFQAVLALALAASLSVFPQGASACSIVWDEAYAEETSDVVVWGTFVADAAEGRGHIAPSRRIKGPKASAYPIIWDVQWADDGASCPVWQPVADHPSGRFFLTANTDGTYSVRAQTPMKKAKH